MFNFAQHLRSQLFFNPLEQSFNCLSYLPYRMLIELKDKLPAIKALEKSTELLWMKSGYKRKIHEVKLRFTQCRTCMPHLISFFSELYGSSRNGSNHTISFIGFGFSLRWAGLSD
jgi:hypothetical protein